MRTTTVYLLNKYRIRVNIYRIDSNRQIVFTLTDVPRKTIFVLDRYQERHCRPHRSCPIWAVTHGGFDKTMKTATLLKISRPWDDSRCNKNKNNKNQSAGSPAVSDRIQWSSLQKAGTAKHATIMSHEIPLEVGLPLVVVPHPLIYG